MSRNLGEWKLLSLAEKRMGELSWICGQTTSIFVETPLWPRWRLSVRPLCGFWLNFPVAASSLSHLWEDRCTRQPIWIDLLSGGRGIFDSKHSDDWNRWNPPGRKVLWIGFLLTRRGTDDGPLLELCWNMGGRFCLAVGCRWPLFIFRGQRRRKWGWGGAAVGLVDWTKYKKQLKQEAAARGLFSFFLFVSCYFLLGAHPRNHLGLLGRGR